MTIIYLLHAKPYLLINKKIIMFMIFTLAEYI